MTEVNRRQTLCLAGAGMAALAGCSETDGDETDTSESTESIDDDGDLPSYASILPDTDREPYFYGAIDFETMFTLMDDEDPEAGSEPTDPLIGNPIVVALLSSFGLSLLANSNGAQAYSAHDSTSSEAGTFVYADGVYALVGEYDRDGLAASLEDAGYDVETAGESYTIYADAETDEIVGITDEVYAFSYPNQNDSAFDPVTAVEQTVLTATGQQEPKHATDDDFEWLLRAGESNGITLGLYTGNDEFDAETLEQRQLDDEADSLEFDFGAFDGAYGVHQQLSLENEDARASALITYRDEDRVDIDRLESSLGTEADSVDVIQDETAVSIAAEYAGDLS